MIRHIVRIFILLICVSLSTILQSHPSWGIIVDDQKNVYFADIGHNGRGSVWKLYPCGEIELVLQDFHAHNVSFDSQGNIVTSHGEGNHLMVRLNKDGSIDTLFQTLDHDQFFGGNSTYTINDEILFGIDHHIWRLLADGTKIKVSDYYFEWNQALFSDNRGNIYAPDKALQNGSLIKINIYGKAEIIATNLLANLDRPRDKHNDVLLGMGTDDNHVYICESAGRRILRINNSNQTNVYYTSEGSWFPTGIYFKNGGAYILEYNDAPLGMEGPQIVYIDKSSNKRILFNYESYFNI